MIAGRIVPTVNRMQITTAEIFVKFFGYRPMPKKQHFF
jgi:hypothetical protein